MQHTMKRAVKRILGAAASVRAGIIRQAKKRFNWQEAKAVETATLVNAIFAIVFYALALACVCAALFRGAWHQLAVAFISCIMGAVMMQDSQRGNEKAARYIKRCFSKK